MKNIFVTRQIPEPGITMLRDAGYEVDVSEKDGALTPEELQDALSKKEYDALLPLLTDNINASVMDTVSSVKVISNYAVGFNNIDTDAAKERGIIVTNTPGVLTDTVAEYAMALILSVVKRIPEADRFTREGKYKGWAPELFLGNDLKGKVLGVLGAGRIGYGVAVRANKGFDMDVIYYDIKPNEHIEKDAGAIFKETVEEVLSEADIVTVHVPLLDTTRHLINAERLAMMKPTACLINTSRGPVVDEKALVQALKDGTIKAAGLDVFEDEPELAPELASLDNVTITPHIASASIETRGKMSEIAAQNIINVLEDKEPTNRVA